MLSEASVAYVFKPKANTTIIRVQNVPIALGERYQVTESAMQNDCYDSVRNDVDRSQPESCISAQAFAKFRTVSRLELLQ